MKKIIHYLIMIPAIAILSGCYKVDEGNFKELAPIKLNEVSQTINVKLGEKLIYEELKAESRLPIKYQWAYGKKSTSLSAGEFDMSSITPISEDPKINYTFTRLGSYILRLRMDNGESIVYKYFYLNVNSGLDEGVLLLANDELGNGLLTFIKKRTEEEVQAGQQEIWTNVFNTVNPEYSIKRGTDLYLSSHTTAGVQYSQILLSCDDEHGSIYKLEPKTLEVLGTNKMRAEFGTAAANIVGDAAVGSTYNYALLRGINGHTYRYDLFSDFIGERVDASNAGLVSGAKMLVYLANRKPVLYNEHSLFQPGNGKVTTLSLKDHKIVNFYSDRDKNKTYVLLKSEKTPDSYTIQQTTGSLAKYKSVKNFTESDMKMDENSIMVSSLKSNDVYYSFGNAVYRWSMLAAPSSLPAIKLPDGEEICDMATNYMGRYADGTEETLLYIATYNPSRTGVLKGSLYVYAFSDNSLVKSYEGISHKIVKILYKYRLS